MRHTASAQAAFAERHACQEADHAHAEHLPGHPGALGEQIIRHQHGHSTHQEERHHKEWGCFAL